MIGEGGESGIAAKITIEDQLSLLKFAAIPLSL